MTYLFPSILAALNSAQNDAIWHLQKILNICSHNIIMKNHILVFKIYNLILSQQIAKIKMTHTFTSSSSIILFFLFSSESRLSILARSCVTVCLISLPLAELDEGVLVWLSCKSSMCASNVRIFWFSILKKGDQII